MMEPRAFAQSLDGAMAAIVELQCSEGLFDRIEIRAIGGQ